MLFLFNNLILYLYEKYIIVAGALNQLGTNRARVE